MKPIKLKPIAFVVGLFLLFGIPTAARGQITVGIADFENRTGRFYLDSWSQKIPIFLQSEFSGATGIELVERQNIKAVLDERALSQSGLVDSAAAEKIQSLSGADYLITGTIAKTGDGIRIDARIISAASGKVVNEKVQCRNDDHLDEMVSLLGKNLAYQLTGQGDRKERIKLAKSPVRPALLVTAGLGLATFVIHSQYDRKRQDYRDETDIGQIDAKYDAANRLYKTRSAFFILTGTSALAAFIFWTSNLNADVILASEPPVSPYVLADGRGNWSVGLAMRF